MTNYKQLCAELVRIVDALDNRAPLAANQGQALDGYAALAAFRDVANRARAELDKPEPERPTDEDLIEPMPQQMRDDLSTAARAMAGFDPDNIKAASVFRIILNRHIADHARAVLARWGNHPGSPDSSLQPIPVSERLPEPKDCNREGKCWWFCFECPGEHSHWIFAKEVYCDPTYWLPAHALPAPS